MTSEITLLTERTNVAQQWQLALSNHGLESKVVGPSHLARAVSGQSAVVVDIDPNQRDDDDLLATIGFVRASGAIPVAHVYPKVQPVEDIIAELCDGLVTSDDRDVARVASCLPRRFDRQRGMRFEFVTVSPCGDEVLAVLGDGEAVLVERPLDPVDDQSEIVGISIDQNAGRATLELTSGVSCHLKADALRSASGTTNGAADIAIDGEKLGARLKELRLAAGLTQAELARRTGIHRPNIARVEAGRHTPSLETLSRIASAIGVSTTHVLASPET